MCSPADGSLTSEPPRCAKHGRWVVLDVGREMMVGHHARKRGMRDGIKKFFLFFLLRFFVLSPGPGMKRTWHDAG